MDQSGDEKEEKNKADREAQKNQGESVPAQEPGKEGGNQGDRKEGQVPGEEIGNQGDHKKELVPGEKVGNQEDHKKELVPEKGPEQAASSKEAQVPAQKEGQQGNSKAGQEPGKEEDKRPAPPTLTQKPSKGGKGKGVGGAVALRNVATPQKKAALPHTPNRHSSSSNLGLPSSPKPSPIPAKSRASPRPAKTPSKSPATKTQAEKTPGSGKRKRESSPLRDPPKKLSPAAVDRRLRRTMEPKTDGTYKVPTEVLEQWKDKEKRPKLMAMFEKLGYQADRCLKSVLPDTLNPKPTSPRPLHPKPFKWPTSNPNKLCHKVIDVVNVSHTANHVEFSSTHSCLSSR